KSTEDRQRDADLRLLPGIFLQVAANHQAKKLLAAAKLDICPDFHAVSTLHEWVEAFVHVDCLTFPDALREVVTFQHALHGNLRHQTEHIEEMKTGEPFAVVAHLRLVNVDDFAHLLQVIASVGFDLVYGETSPRLIPAARIAHEGGVVADDNYGFVAKL